MKRWAVSLDGKDFTLEQLREMTDEELSDFVDRLCADRFDEGAYDEYIKSQG